MTIPQFTTAEATSVVIGMGSTVRPRRLRRTAALRSMVREHHVRREDLILPLFVCPGKSVRIDIDAMPGSSWNLSFPKLFLKIR